MTDGRFRLLEHGQTCVANIKIDRDLIEWAEKRELAVYIGRENGRFKKKRSAWHNPYRVTKDITNEQAVAQYRDYLMARHELLARIEELRGKLLCCWCYPNLCHGNVLIELLEKKGMRKMS